MPRGKKIQGVCVCSRHEIEICFDTLFIVEGVVYSK